MNTPSRTPHPGAFIVIEGVDGAGKTTVAKALAERLNEHPDYNGAIYVREPGSTPYGEQLREAFLHTAEPIDPMSEVLTLLACKNELLKKVIQPAVAAGKIVICDRYTRTLLAYQGGLRGLGFAYVANLIGLAGLMQSPHVEFFLSVDEATSIARRSTHLNALDELAASKAQALREAFALSREHVGTYRMINVDANGEAASVLETVVSEALRFLKFHRITGLSLTSTAVDNAELDALNPDNEAVLARLIPRTLDVAAEAPAVAETFDASPATAQAV